ncbi:MAG: amidohydrolase family protein [Actinomycetota bacterium]
MRVDVHAHHYDPRYLDALTRAGSSDPRVVAFAPGSKLSLRERSVLLGDAGIDVQILSISALMPDVPTAGDALALAQLSNDIYHDAATGNDGRYRAFGAAPLPHVDEAIEETGRCLDELAMLGMTVGCSMGGRPLDDPAFDPFFAELDRRGAVLFLHPRGTGCGPHSEEFGMPWIIGAPIEDAIACLRLILSGMLDRYPDIRFIIPHLGGMLPFVAQRLDDSVERQRTAGFPHSITTPPTEYLRRLWFDTVSEHIPALRCACDSVGADRLLLGTDFPFTESLRRCVTYVEEAGLSKTDETAILERTAETLLGLEPVGEVGGP